MAEAGNGDGGSEKDQQQASGAVSESVENTEENAQRLFDAACVALKDSEFDVAIDNFAKALEIRIGIYGEFAPECATTYLKYGTALLRKVESERDVLGDDKLKLKEPRIPEAETQEDNCEEDEDEDEEEDASDMELAWNVLEIARRIHEEQRIHSLEEVEVILSLADLNLEKADFQTCFDDYLKALEILQGLVEPDNRRLAELYFKMTLARQVEGKTKDALECCEKAISVCELRLQTLKNVSEPTSDTEAEMAEVEALLTDLKEKAEDLSSDRPILEQLEAECPEAADAARQAYCRVADAFASVGGKAVEGGVSKAQEGGSSSQPSTSNETVTHLGVVGRGIKRTAPIPIEDNQSEKRSSNDNAAAA